MEIEGQYLTYEDYKALGGTLDLMSFNLLEFEARKKIDLRTQCRLLDINDIPQEVKICIYHIIDKVLNSYNKNINRGKSSETVGSYHVTYNDMQEIIKNKNAEIDDIILNDLYGVIVNNEHILYLGVE